MNIQQRVDKLINNIEYFNDNRIKELVKLRSMYNKEQPEYWELTAVFCKEKARRLR